MNFSDVEKILHNKMKDDWRLRRTSAAKLALAGLNMKFLVQVFDLTASQIKYWKKKVTNPNFHPSSHGGKRYSKQNDTANLLLYYLAASIPTSTISEFGESLRVQLGVKYTDDMIHRIFDRGIGGMHK